MTSIEHATPVLEAHKISKAFLGVRALVDVSITVRRGEVHALVGENGAGKSTLIKVLTGVYAQDDGRVLYRGKPVKFRNPHAARADGISTIYQEGNLVLTQSVARNLFLGREPRNRFGFVDFKAMHDQARALLTDFGIAADVHRPLGSLGTAAQQMVAIARAAALDADVVIMDEPTSSLEPREVETLFGVIDRLRHAGVAIIYVSHRLDELYRICDTVTVLREGRTVHQGPMAELPRPKLVASMLGREYAPLQLRHLVADDDVPDTMAPILEVNRLSRRGLLDDISLSIRPGEVVGLAGLFGSGRTETGMAVLGAQRIDSGTVAVDGQTVRARTPAASIDAGVALIPEDRTVDGILPNLSIRDNIVLGALPRLSRLGIVASSRIDALVSQFMEDLNIQASGPEQKVGTLSGGNQQKVLLARMLCLNPKVLILDEPTRGIDIGAKIEVRVTIDALAAEGLAVLLISSETDELVEGSDRIVVLKEGRVIDVLTGGRLSEDDLILSIAGPDEPPGSPFTQRGPTPRQPDRDPQR